MITRTEQRLWFFLRQMPWPLIWIPQVPIGRRRMDLFCPQLMTCIEVDGSSHASARAREDDAFRDDELRDVGVRTRRVTAADVEADPVAVTNRLRQALMRRLAGEGLRIWTCLPARTVERMPPSLSHLSTTVWDLYQDYEQLRLRRGVQDSDDVLLAARDLVRAGAPSGFDAVIVDEVQDLTCVGLQLLHAYVGDKPDGLLIVGDGQQAIYPGGFTLSEAGVSVVGRSTVLSRNYRNREAVVRYAQSVLGEDTFDDLDNVPEHANRDVVTERPGGDVHEVRVADVAAQEAALCAHLLRLRKEQNVRLGDCGVLVPTNAEAGRWCSALTAHGIPAILLETYDGMTTDAVKVGTYHRAKGLEFAHVCIPDRDRFPAARRAGESIDMFTERVTLQRRQLYVALTRARDGLWAGMRN